jgi:hypothetical protein
MIMSSQTNTSSQNSNLALSASNHPINPFINTCYNSSVPTNSSTVPVLQNHIQQPSVPSTTANYNVADATATTLSALSTGTSVADFNHLLAPTIPVLTLAVLAPNGLQLIPAIIGNNGVQNPSGLPNGNSSGNNNSLNMNAASILLQNQTNQTLPLPFALAGFGGGGAATAVAPQQQQQNVFHQFGSPPTLGLPAVAFAGQAGNSTATTSPRNVNAAEVSAAISSAMFPTANFHQLGGLPNNAVNNSTHSTGMSLSSNPPASLGIQIPSAMTAPPFLGASSAPAPSTSSPDAASPVLTNRPPIPLSSEYDSQALTPYQCLLR